MILSVTGVIRLFWWLYVDDTLCDRCHNTVLVVRVDDTLCDRCQEKTVLVKHLDETSLDCAGTKVY